MPELPDIILYLEALQNRVLHRPLLHVRIAHPFLLRTVEPPLSATENKQVRTLRRIGKRLVIGLERELWHVIHLMIAGRLHWRKPGAVLHGKGDQAALDFPDSSLVLSETGTKKKASLHVLHGEDAPSALNPGGIEVLESDAETFAKILTRTNHTLKRALIDPQMFSGIGNAYSDEILFRAGLSPIQMTQKLSREQIQLLFEATRETLQEWIDKLRRETGGEFPEKVIAFREDMAVHGRYRLPCRVCGSLIQRIRYATSEANYCARCQTNGKLLADRAMSRLLRTDWPRTLDELENRTLVRKEISEP